MSRKIVAIGQFMEEMQSRKSVALALVLVVSSLIAGVIYGITRPPAIKEPSFPWADRRYHDDRNLPLIQERRQ
jgi:hypothetical protein